LKNSILNIVFTYLEIIILTSYLIVSPSTIKSENFKNPITGGSIIQEGSLFSFANINRSNKQDDERTPKSNSDKLFIQNLQFKQTFPDFFVKCRLFNFESPIKPDYKLATDQKSPPADTKTFI